MLLQMQQEQEINIADLVNIVIRRRQVFFGGFLAVFTIAFLYTFLMQPVFQSTSTLYVKDDAGKIGLNELVMPGGSNPISAELEILKSRTIAEQVVRKLHLDWSITPPSNDAACKITTITSPPALQQLTLTMTGPDSYEIRDGNGHLLGTAPNGARFHNNGLTLTAKLYGSKGDRFKIARVPFNSAVRGLKGGIEVKEVGRATNVIEVSYQNTDAELSRNIVNTVVQAYLEQSLAFKTQEASRSVHFIEEQLQGIKDDLNKAEQNLQEYKSTTGIVQLDAEAMALISKYSGIEQQRASITLKKKQLEFALASQQENLAHGKPYSPAVMTGDPLVAQMAQQLSSLEVQKRSLLVEYTTSHPAVQNLQAQIDEIQQKIRSTYRTGLRNLEKEESDVTAQLGGYEADLRRIPAAERDLARYTRLAKVTGDIYTFLLQKHEEARIAKASTISNINIIDTAITPDGPIKPEKTKYLSIGMLLGIMVGIGLAFFVDYLDDTVKNEHEAKNVLGFPHLATIPHIGNDDGNEEEINLSTFTHSDQRSIAAEAFRSLRTAVHFSAINKEKNVLVITSSFAGEGKSTISSNLAVTIAQTGARTLLVDSDMHKSALHQRLGLKKVPGLSEILASDTTITEAMHESGIPGLTVLTAGTMPPNPSVLLGSQAMHETVQKLKGMFDYIIIDAPPTLPVTDTVVLSAMADMVLIVMEAGRVPAKAAGRMNELLTNAQAPVAGFVFNNKTLRGMKYGYGSGYGYGYGYGYGSEHDGKHHKKHRSVFQKLLAKLSDIKLIKS